MRLDEYKYSQNLILRPGDSIRLKEGPYYERKDGSKSSHAFRGNAVIEWIEDTKQGVVLHCQEITRGGMRWAMVAARINGKTVKTVGGIITSRPYKVTKARTPHVVHEVPFPKAT